MRTCVAQRSCKCHSSAHLGIDHSIKRLEERTAAPPSTTPCHYDSGCRVGRQKASSRKTHTHAHARTQHSQVTIGGAVQQIGSFTLNQVPPPLKSPAASELRLSVKLRDEVSLCAGRLSDMSRSASYLLQPHIYTHCTPIKNKIIHTLETQAYFVRLLCRQTPKTPVKLKTQKG